VRSLFGEAFEYQRTVPFFSLFMATLSADPPVGDADALRRLGGSADLRYWVVHDLADAIHAAAAGRRRGSPSPARPRNHLGTAGFARGVSNGGVLRRR